MSRRAIWSRSYERICAKLGFSAALSTHRDAASHLIRTGKATARDVEGYVLAWQLQTKPPAHDAVNLERFDPVDSPQPAISFQRPNYDATEIDLSATTPGQKCASLINGRADLIPA